MADTGAGWLDVVNVLLGWFLGTATTALTDWRRTRGRSKDVRRAIRRELRESAHRFLITVFKLGQRAGTVDRQLLEWLLPQIDRYEGPNPSADFRAGVVAMLSGTDAELKAAMDYARASMGPQFVPREHLSYTSGATSELHEQDADYTVRVLDVLSHIQMFNEARDNGMYYLRLTFRSGLSAKNHAIVTKQISGSERQMAFRARVIVEKITELEMAHPN